MHTPTPNTVALLQRLRLQRSLGSTTRTQCIPFSSVSSTPSTTRSRLAIGGSKLAQTQQDGVYPSVIATSLQNSVMTFESGLGGDEKLKRAYVDAVMFLKNVHNQDLNLLMSQSQNGIELTSRFGYRTGGAIIDGDVVQQDSDKGEKVYHNLSSEYVQQVLETSPLVHLYQGKPNNTNTPSDAAEEEMLFSDEFRQHLNLTFMAHNPEAQGSEMYAKNAPVDEVREYIREQMTQAFIGLETGVAEGQITSYGVSSNGLSIPSSHPLHLSWEDILQASSQAAEAVHGSDSGKVANLSTIQLPINLLETFGLKTANRIKDYLLSPDRMESNLPENIRIFAMRPLTCYPDRGTGTGLPFKLVDYLIPNSLTDPNDKSWTHENKGLSSQLYTKVLNETMSHFDATHILEIKEEEERELTTEERETIDGCKLLQSMIHDLDANLTSGQIRSFAAYEEELYSKVVPLIHDTFEELDAESADILHRFFHIHGNAVRQSIARITRESLKGGGEGVGKYDIPDDMSLQQFALNFLWDQSCNGEFAKGPIVDKVVVGCPKAEHVIEAVKMADDFQSRTKVT